MRKNPEETKRYRKRPKKARVNPQKHEVIQGLATSKDAENSFEELRRKFSGDETVIDEK